VTVGNELIGGSGKDIDVGVCPGTVVKVGVDIGSATMAEVGVKTTGTVVNTGDRVNVGTAVAVAIPLVTTNGVASGSSGEQPALNRMSRQITCIHRKVGWSNIESPYFVKQLEPV
jgi:hypothetical protein